MRPDDPPCIARNRPQSVGRSRGGLTSKIHALVDTNGLPIRLAVTCWPTVVTTLTESEPLLPRGAFGPFGPKSRQDAIATIRSALARTSTRARNLVERFFNKIKQCRRVATRYDKLAVNYLAFIQLASIRLWLRVNESTP
jgi:hypothetical protein